MWNMAQEINQCYHPRVMRDSVNSSLILSISLLVVIFPSSPQWVTSYSSSSIVEVGRYKINFLGAIVQYYMHLLSHHCDLYAQCTLWRWLYYHQNYTLSFSISFMRLPSFFFILHMSLYSFLFFSTPSSSQACNFHHLWILFKFNVF